MQWCTVMKNAFKLTKCLTNFSTIIEKEKECCDNNIIHDISLAVIHVETTHTQCHVIQLIVLEFTCQTNLLKDLLLFQHSLYRKTGFYS